MAYERRGRRLHYYDKVRDGDTVRSIHVRRPLGRYFARLATARNAHQSRRRDRRRTVTETVHELKLLLGYLAVLQAALLYAVGYYRQSGTWRKRVRAKLFGTTGGATGGATGGTAGVFDPFDFSTTPDGPASPAALGLHHALQMRFDPRNDDLAQSDALFGQLGEVVRLLDERRALPGDLWVLRHAHLLGLFDAWMIRAARLQEALLKRVPSLPGIQSDALQRTRATSAVKHDGRAADGRTVVWEGGTDYRHGITQTTAAAAASLASLDRFTLAGYRGLHPGTYTPKQWQKAFEAARARQVRTKRHLTGVICQDEPHLVALTDAGDLVHVGGFVGEPEEEADEFAGETSRQGVLWEGAP